MFVGQLARNPWPVPLTNQGRWKSFRRSGAGPLDKGNARTSLSPALPLGEKLFMYPQVLHDVSVALGNGSAEDLGAR
jgi:hypothetical protein